MEGDRQQQPKQPAYMASLLEHLTADELTVVQELKQCGQLVRSADTEMRAKARAKAETLQEELRVAKEEGTLYAQHCLSELKEKKMQHDQSDGEKDGLLARLKSCVEAMKRLKAEVDARRAKVEELMENPPGFAERQAAIDAFNETLVRLSAICARYEKVKRVPWQLEQCGSADTDAEGAVVPLEGGRILDAEGKNIWGACCYLCGWELQDGAKGEGLLRFHCLDAPSADRCETCHRIMVEMEEEALSRCKESGKEDRSKRREVEALLREVDPHLGLLFVGETNIDVFLRDPILEASTLAASVHSMFQAYAPRPCLGTRTKLLRSSLAEEENAGCCLGGYTWQTYDQVYKKVTELAGGLTALMDDETVLGICSSNRPEWLYADFAATLNSFVSVGLHVSWPANEVEYVINNAEISCVICDWATLDTFLEVASRGNCPSLRFVVVMPDTSEVDDKELLLGYLEKNAPQRAGWKHQIQCLAWREVVTIDATSSSAKRHDSRKPKTSQEDDELHSLIYSSGTTGVPKGIVATKGQWRRDNVLRPNFMVPNAVLSYAALAHGMDRGMCWQTLSNGGRVGICSNGEDNIIEDAQQLEPVLFVAMPHIWNKIYAEYSKELLAQSSSSSCEGKSEVKTALMNKYSKILGSRLQQIATGGAPISAEVFAWMKECFDCVVVNAYGTTETPGISTDGIIPSYVTVELRDVPEMGYFTTDKPFPRGEIWVQTPTMATSYYRLPEETAKAFTDGFFLTGDIGMIDDKGLLHIIDRKKNMLELYVDGRSVWIPAGETEAEFLTHSSTISQIYLHGDRAQPCLVAAVVPSSSFLQSWRQKADSASPDTTADEELCNMKQVKEEIMAELASIATKLGFEKHFVPGGLILEAVPWTTSSGLLTPTHKLARGKLLQRYKLRFDMEWATLNREMKVSSTSGN